LKNKEVNKVLVVAIEGIKRREGGGGKKRITGGGCWKGRGRLVIPYWILGERSYPLG
jgi:hypothetical protein